MTQRLAGRRHPAGGGVGSYLELEDILHALKFLLKSAIEIRSQRAKFQSILYSHRQSTPEAQIPTLRPLILQPPTTMPMARGNSRTGRRIPRMSRPRRRGASRYCRSCGRGRQPESLGSAPGTGRWELGQSWQGGRRASRHGR